MKSKRHLQLGMNPSTASHRLVKDVLFKFVELGEHKCFRCDKKLTRGTFSIEHKEPWMDSDNPIGLYFDLDNIAFSHLSCNISAGRRPTKGTGIDRKEYDTLYIKKRWAKLSKEEKIKTRRERYLKYGH